MIIFCLFKNYQFSAINHFDQGTRKWFDGWSLEGGATDILQTPTCGQTFLPRRRAHMILHRVDGGWFCLGEV